MCSCVVGGGEFHVARDKRGRDVCREKKNYKARKSCCVLSVCCAGWLTSSLTGHNRQRFVFFFLAVILLPLLVSFTPLPCVDMLVKHVLSSLHVGTQSVDMYAQ